MTTIHSAPSGVSRRVTGQGKRPPDAESTTTADSWVCENCSEDNSLRRRRCRDCGTSRH